MRGQSLCHVATPACLSAHPDGCAQPGGPRWPPEPLAIESLPWEGCIAHTHNFAFPNILPAANVGVGSKREGATSKPAFIMEEINLSRVIFSQEEINF